MKMGFGLGLGSMLAAMVYVFIGLLFFIPGLMLLGKERKKAKEEQNNTNIAIAYLLMILGAIFGLGMGFNFIATNLISEF